MIKYHQNQTHKSLPQNAQLDVSIFESKQFINFCLENLSIKKLNIELWEGISECIAKPYIEGLIDKEQRLGLWEAIKRIYHLIFNYDMKMVYISSWMADALIKVN